MEKNKMVLGGVLALVILAGGVLLLTNMNSDDETTNDTANSSQVEQTSQPQQNESAETEAAQTIVELAVATDSLSTLVTAVTEADLVDTLSGDGPFTVFAPTNAAFEKLPEGTLDTLLQPENKEKLQAVLTYHVVSGKVMSGDLKDGQEITTVQGAKLTVMIADGKVMLEDATGAMATVAQADIEASNGVVHVIDSVVLPE